LIILSPGCLTGPITIFCPTNEAFKAMMDNKAEMVKGFNGNTTQFKQVFVSLKNE
jgi:uncharacterized surface protein with fasciclin (FAS1) repeats